MVKKIGKLLILLYSTFLGAESAVDLQILSTAGQPLKAVAVGVPFVIAVSLKNFTQETNTPYVAGIEQLELLHTSQQMNTMIINGTTTSERKYLFQVRARESGTLTIGPASITKPQALQSSVVSLPVEAESTKTTLKGKAQYEFIIDKKEPFVGEKVPFTLRFSYAQPDLKIRALEEPEVKEIRIQTNKEVIAKNVSQAGQAYTVQEVHGYLYPEEPGTFVLPALIAEFAAPDTSFGIFSFFAKREQIYSNAVTLKVLPLPPTSEAAHAVGKFRNLYATISQSQINQGEGTALTISVEGTGNVESAKAPTLVLPEGLKYYESKATVEGQGPDYVKRFEYVVQAIQPGAWLIPQQSFVYFDPEKKAYKTLYTKPLPLEVKEGTPVTPVEQGMPEEPQEQPSAEKDFIPQSLWHLPLWLFACLLAFPLFVLVSKELFIRLQQLLRKRYTGYRAFAAARSKIKNAQADTLYTSIKEAFAQYLVKSSITQEDIEKVLTAWGLTYEEKMQWQQFVTALLEHSSYAPSHSKKNVKELIHEADTWLSLFYKKAKMQPTLTLMMLCLISFSLVSEPREGLLNKALYMRRAEQTTWGSDVASIDTEVENLKEQAGTVSRKRYSPLFTTLYYAFSKVPFVIWQLFFICLWWALIFYGSLVKMRYRILLVLAWLFVGWGVITIVYGKYGQWAFVQRSQALLYIGPDTTYPNKGELSFLDEVYTMKKQGNWYYVSSPLGTGWLSGRDIELV